MSIFSTYKSIQFHFYHLITSTLPFHYLHVLQYPLSQLLILHVKVNYSFSIIPKVTIYQRLHDYIVLTLNHAFLVMTLSIYIYIWHITEYHLIVALQLFIFVNLIHPDRHPIWFNSEIRHFIKHITLCCRYVTGLVKRGLPHTSNLPTLTIHNFSVGKVIALKVGQYCAPT